MASRILDHKIPGSESSFAHSATCTEFDITRAISKVADCRNALSVWIAAANSEDREPRTCKSSMPLRLAARAIGQRLDGIHVGHKDREELVLNAQGLMQMVELALRNYELGSARSPLDNELVSAAQMVEENLGILANLLATADENDSPFERFLHAVGLTRHEEGMGA